MFQEQNRDQAILHGARDNILDLKQPSQQTMDSNIYLLDYGAGNVRSLINAVDKLGFAIRPITCVEDFERADVSPC